MNRPWQIWTLFLACLAVTFMAMGWLTIKALELDDAGIQAQENLSKAQQEAERQHLAAEQQRRSAELEEDISRALWRMDTWLAPLLAEEAARPYFVYEPTYATPAGGKTPGALVQNPSPLNDQPSENILLHFQLDKGNNISSPQYATGPALDVVVGNGVSKQQIGSNFVLLNELKEVVEYDDILSQLPEESLPVFQLSQAPSEIVKHVANIDSYRDNYNSLGIAELDSQVAAAQTLQDANNEKVQASANQQRANAQRVVNQTDEPTGQAVANPRQTQNTRINNTFDNQGYSIPRDKSDQKRRGGIEWAQRNRQYQGQTNKAIVEQRVLLPTNNIGPTSLSEGVSRPLWVGKRLLFARRVTAGSDVMVQGCWLDWDKIRTNLLEQVGDLLADVNLIPVNPKSNVDSARMLATLPVQIVVPEPMGVESLNVVGAIPVNVTSPIRMSLWFAWGCLSVAAIAVAALLLGVVTLSERRGAFVSAVTHELRTPLTTFRMYSEMLSEGMIRDTKQQNHYLQTLRVEADRLSHLVENVLAYARLERGRPGGRREDVTIGALLDRTQSRLEDRSGQGEMQFVIDAQPDDGALTLHTDPAAVEQVLFNLVDNACKYASAAEDRRIHLRVIQNESGTGFEVSDHGPGIPPESARRLFRPFHKSCDDAAVTAPGVGLGLALCRRLASDLGGTLEIAPPRFEGATFLFKLP